MKKVMKVLVAVVGFVVLNLLFSGCSASRNMGLVEVPRSAVLNNPQLRAGSLFVDVNPYTCTWVVDRIYRGNLSRDQAIGNINGRVVLYNDYLFKVELSSAITYNQENSPSLPNVVRVILDPDTTYTVVRYVGWGRWIFQKDYSLEVFTIRTSKDAIGQCWTDKQGRSECANVVSVASGSNEASYARLNLNFQVNGTQLGRNAIGALMEAGRK